MATLTFYLRKKTDNPKDFASIYFNYQINNDKYRAFTGLKMKSANWDKENQRAKKNSALFTETNEQIEEIIAAFQHIERRARMDKVPLTIEYARKNFLIKNQQAQEEKFDFFTCFENYIGSAENKKSKGTITTYKVTLKHLKGFQTRKRFMLDFDKVNISFFEKFTDYLINDLEFQSNTVGKIVKVVKSFMNYAIKKGYTNNIGFKNELKVWKIDTDIVYLTKEEFLKLLYMDLSNNKRLSDVRDVFCFGITTGLRYSDIRNLRRENIRNDELHLNTQKTRQQLCIPLNRYAQMILSRHPELISVLPSISNQKSNEYIKELCELAEINEPVQITKFRGTQRIAQILPKYQLISTHTARRTFITLSLENGVRPEVLMQITGHRTIKSFYRYVKITDKVKKHELTKAWNF